MAEDLGTIYYEVDARLDPFLRGSSQAERNLGRMTSRMDESDRSARRMERGLDRAGRSATGLGTQVSRLTTAIRGFIAVSALMQGARMVQEYQEMSERVRDSTDSVAEFEMVQRRLQATAEGTYRPLSEAQEAFIQASRGLKGLGYDTEQALDVVDSLSYAFVRNATSSDRAQSAMNALVRATNRGTVLTDHWASLLVAVPTLLDNISDATGRSAEEISALGYAGQLSAQDLTEGLRKALDENRAAADEMANSLADAGIQMSQAFTAVLVAIEDQTGALDTLTNAIIKAAKWIQDFAEDGESMERVLAAMEFAAISTAAVMAGRLVVQLTAVVRGLGSVAAAATAARGALAFLGGPVGVALLAAGGVYTLYKRSRDAADEMDRLSDSINKMSASELTSQIAEYEAEAALLLQRMQEIRDFEYSTPSALSGMNQHADAARLSELQAEYHALQEAIWQMSEALYDQEEASESAEVRLRDMASTTDDATSAAARHAQSLRDQIALLKTEGLERVRLEARQRAGADATEDQIALAERLAVEVYGLSRAERARAAAEQEAEREREEIRRKAEEDAQKARDAAEANEDAFERIREQMRQTAMSARELAARQAELTLNEYATPEQVAEIRALAEEAYDAGEAIRALRDAERDRERLREEISRDPSAFIRGDMSPLSGGLFDDQAQRYEAERVREEERYAASLQRLQEAKDLEIEVVGGYYALEEQMASEHANRMQQIQEAQNKLQEQNIAEIFASTTQIMKDAFGEQSAAYRAAFAVEKAFAIARSIIAIQQGIAQAAANPWPVNLAAMASVAAATASIVSNIQSVRVGGTRALGGPVSAGSAYRVNEGGRPEVFTDARGHQYMIPNTRGEVISNANATGQVGGGVVVNLIESPDRGGLVDERQEGGQTVIDIFVADIMADGESARAIQSKYGLDSVGR